MKKLSWSVSRILVILNMGNQCVFKVDFGLSPLSQGFHCSEETP